MTGPDVFVEVDIAVDCLEAATAFERGDFEVALSLLRGRFLGGFELSDSREFYEWREAQETRFDQYRTDATRALIEESLGKRAADRAIILAQDWVATNPLLEEPTRTLISILESQGQLTAAMARVREYETLLKSATGGEPSRLFRQQAAALQAKLPHASVLGDHSIPGARRLAGEVPEPVQVPPLRTPRPLRASANRLILLALIIASVATIAFGASVVWRRATPPSARLTRPFPGRLYVTGADWLADSSNVAVTYRAYLPSGADDVGRMEPLASRPSHLPPLLLQLPVGSPGETHTKIFAIRERDTTQLTFGLFDDGPALWSPDGRWIAVQRGWRVGDDYRFNLFVVDSGGAEIRQITEGNVQDVLLAWSPDGTRLALARIEGGLRSLWLVDSDGAHAENLESRFSVPDVAGAAFSADGAQLAVLVSEGESVELLDLRQSTQRTLAPGCQGKGTAIAWSPDARWLALICANGANRYLSVLSTSGSERYDRIADAPTVILGELVWLSDTPTYVDRVAIDGDSLVVSAGAGQLVGAHAQDVAGTLMAAPLRWSVRDLGVASVDRRGFLRGRRPGTTRLIASAGGFRRDSVRVVVVSSTVDTLLYEDWGGGIDPSVWQIVGVPPPVTLPEAADSAYRVFLSNGDHNWPSGVLSVVEFSSTEGLTLEFDASFQFTGLHWQELEAALVPKRRAITSGERSVKARMAWWWVTGPSPAYRRREMACGVDYVDTVRGDTIPLAEGAWHLFALQLRPDGVVECYLNGLFLGDVDVGRDRVHDAVAVYLGGRTNKTAIYHGQVLVTRGLRY